MESLVQFLMFLCLTKFQIVDIQTCIVLHQFEIERDKAHAIISPIKSMHTSSDGKWLAISDAGGDITVFNLETFL